MKSEAPIFETIEAGQYYADFADIKEFTSEFGRTFRWFFNVYVDGKVISMSDLSSAEFTPKAKARGWVQTMLGREVEPGEIVDYDTLFGTRVLLVVAINDAGYNRIELMTKPTDQPIAQQVVEAQAAPAGGPEGQPILIAGDQKVATSGPAAGQVPPEPPPPPPPEQPFVNPDEAPF